MSLISSNSFLYRDRFICLELLNLKNEQDYAACAFWNEPYINNAHTLIYFASGSWDVKVEGYEYQPQPGEICILRCLETCLLTPVEYPCSMYRISFSSHYFKIVDPNFVLNIPFTKRPLGVGNFYRIPESEQARLSKNIFRIQDKTNAGDKRLALFVTLIDLLHEICDLYHPHMQDKRSPQAREVLDYINAHYCEDIGIHTLTQQLYMSRSQIERIIKTATGYSTWNYILQKRITRATQLLHGGMGNREVAQATGFRDYSTFYKAYVKIAHQTPTGEHPSIDNDPLLKNFYRLDKANFTWTDKSRKEKCRKKY